MGNKCKADRDEDIRMIVCGPIMTDRPNKDVL